MIQTSSNHMTANMALFDWLELAIAEITAEQAQFTFGRLFFRSVHTNISPHDLARDGKFLFRITFEDHLGRSDHICPNSERFSRMN